MRFSKYLAAAALALISTQASAVTIQGTDAIYGAGLSGHGNNKSTAPAEFNFVNGIGTFINVTNVTGLTSCCAHIAPNANADGLGGNIGNGSTNINAANGISGIQVNGRQLFLAGVFVDAANLPSGAAPAKLTYPPLSLSAASYTPLLNQAFFIGDGLTGTGTGDVQRFVAPDSANRLLLGFVDGYAFRGAPSYFADNRGALTADVAAVTPSPVPLPAAGLLLLGGLAGLGLMRRRSS